MGWDVDETDELRRLALQIALQLPANVGDARRALALAGECLDQFLIEKTPTAVRAGQLGLRLVVPAASDAASLPARPSSPSPAAVGLCCFAALAFSSGLGLLLLWLFGAGTGVSGSLAVAIIALLFGPRPAILLALLAACSTNLFAVPPSLEFTVPTKVEFAILLVNSAIALAVPWIQARREPLREASRRIVGRSIIRFSRAA